MGHQLPRQQQVNHGIDVSTDEQPQVIQAYSRHSRLPAVLEQRDGEKSVCYTLMIADNNPAFAGHFPNHPVVPGLVQIEWADHFCKPLSIAGQLKNLEAVKFTRLLQPGCTVHLTLELISVDEAATKVKFTYFDENSSFSSGRLVYVE